MYAIAQSAGTVALACRQHVHQATWPTPRLRVKRALQVIAIHPFQLANAIGERLHKLRRVYRRIRVELAIC